MLLGASDVSVRFGGVWAVQNVDLGLTDSEIVGLIGPNGAGKTTLMNVLSGFQKPSAGRIELDGTDITTASPQRRSWLGLARTFQDVRLFQNLTVYENVEAGALGAGLNRIQCRERVSWLLDRLQLSHVAHLPGRSLNHGHQRRVSIGRAIIGRPKFLLLDEPAAGLSEEEKDELRDDILRISDDHSCGILIIDHDMGFIMGLCERIQVLNYGRTIAIGAPAAIQEDPAVVAAYLG
jgi:branched-chain amino acid transport system ATP-binding protein